MSRNSNPSIMSVLQGILNASNNSSSTGNVPAPPPTNGNSNTTTNNNNNNNNSNAHNTACSQAATKLLEEWEQIQKSNQDVIPVLTEMTKLVEKETEAYLKMNPDPFDDRHPSRAYPDCSLGIVLKVLFKNETFMDMLVTHYVLHRDNKELNIIACRLLLDILPGLETAVVFNETEGLVNRLYHWAEFATDPLQSFATGLLAAAMELQEVASVYREQNAHLVPLMLKRLQELCFSHKEEHSSRKENEKEATYLSERPFAHLNKESQENTAAPDKFKTPNSRKQRSASMSPAHSTSPHNSVLNDFSNSSWAELEPLMIGSFQMYPITPSLRQKFILQYLVPMGEYQELLTHVIEYNALKLILDLINLKVNDNVWLAFEALKYLSALLCHKKVAMEFVNMGGLTTLLQVTRPSVAATGVSICLYYLAYSEDAMVRICQFPKDLLHYLVSYALWLLECSHDSSRCHAIMFFTLSFSFKVILELFDEQDGLRKLFNVISTLDIFVIPGEGENSPNLNDDQVFAMRQTARHVSSALKRYFEAHLSIKAEQVRKGRNVGVNLHTSSSQDFKTERPNSQVIQDDLDVMLEHMPLRMRWTPVEELLKMGGVPLLIFILNNTFDWNYSGRVDIAKSILDVLSVCSITPRCRLALCESVKLAESSSIIAMNSILNVADNDLISDPEAQLSALTVIINCVCGPLHKNNCIISKNMLLTNSQTPKRKNLAKSGEDLLTKMWTCVRTNNGIMILLNLLSCKSPLTSADSIRALACKALCGLARCDTVLQIISKLPLFTSGQLQALMQEPILQDQHKEHVKFSKYCISLIERVTGAPVISGNESSIAKINKAEVVAQTKIQYHDKQLLQLIHKHLLSKGLSSSAELLQKEASLSAPYEQRLVVNSTPRLTPRQMASPYQTPVSHRLTPSNATPNLLNQSPGPFKLNLSNLRTPQSSISYKQQKTMEKRQYNYQPSPVIKRQQQSILQSSSAPSISLDSIVTDYLRKQHGLCKNPIVTCPAFDLFVPHQCPEPKFKTAAPTNIASRVSRRMFYPQHGGFNGAQLDRKYIYSRFRPIRTYRLNDAHVAYAGCTFSRAQQLFMGTFNGEVKVYNTLNGSLTEEMTYSCHDDEINHLEVSNDNQLLITSCGWRRPYSMLWNISSGLRQRFTFNQDAYMEFSKQTQDKLVGTLEAVANMYDVHTGQHLATLKDSSLTNKYTKNRATFNPTDELILSDGVLWDVGNLKPIHKFDKFNPSINGVFHPNGLELISNSEVWDLRTFHLLHTIPALDQCRVIFNEKGTVMYGVIGEEEDEQNDKWSPLRSSFRTFDATNYNNIATIDVKKTITGLAVDYTDTYLSIIESFPGNVTSMSPDNVCRLYEVGRRKEVDDEDEDDDEESEEIEDDSEDDGNDDDDQDSLNSFNDSDDDDEDMDDDILFGSSSSDDNDDFDGEEELFAINLNH